MSAAEATLIDRHKARSLEWGRLLSITGGAQVLVQALGFASGLFVIRLLPSQEYAFYTIANTMLGTMTVLADAGIGAGVISQGGKVWQDHRQLGRVLATGLDLRKKFSIISLLVAIPVLIFLLRYHAASWTLSVLLTASLIPAFVATLSDTLLEIAPKLRQDIVPLQHNQIAAAVGRLVLTGSLLFAFPWAVPAILAAGISRTWANIRLRRISSNYADRNQEPDPEVRKAILQVVKRSLPASIYYCLSGQITIWLISFFGSTKAVGQVGALAGFATMMNLFNVMFGTLMVPRFARLPNDKKLLVKRFVLVQIGLIIMSAVLVLLANTFAKELLWVLGKQFAGLNKELTLMAAGSCVAFIGACTNQLLSSRGIVVPPLIFVASAVVAQVALAFVVPLNQVVGVLTYGILTPLAIYAIRLIYLTITLAKHEAYS
jgi:O-antigen/teichoic acid export membrane protein